MKPTLFSSDKTPLKNCTSPGFSEDINNIKSPVESWNKSAQEGFGQRLKLKVNQTIVCIKSKWCDSKKKDSKVEPTLDWGLLRKNLLSVVESLLDDFTFNEPASIKKLKDILEITKDTHYNNKILEIKNQQKESLVSIAVRNGSYIILNELLKAGAKAGRVDRNGDTALLKAVKLCHTDMVKLLLDPRYYQSKPFQKNCPDMEVEDTNKRTPLAVAFNSKRYDLCQLLVNNGAELFTKNNSGQTLLASAVSQLDVQGVEFLKTYGLTNHELKRELSKHGEAYWAEYQTAWNNQYSFNAD